MLVTPGYVSEGSEHAVQMCRCQSYLSTPHKLSIRFVNIYGLVIFGLNVRQFCPRAFSLPLCKSF